MGEMGLELRPLRAADGGTRVPVGRADLYCRVAGEGIPILLIHGGAGSADSWFESFDRLSKRHRVIAYDRRGQNRSGGTPSADWHQEAEDAAALLRELGAAPATVVGWSAGGVPALDLAVNHPDLVRSLALIEPPFHGMKDMTPGLALTFAKLILFRALGKPRAAVNATLKYLGHPEFAMLPESVREAMLANTAGVFGDGRAGLGHHLTEGMIRSIRCPVLLIEGDRSVKVHAGGVRRLRRWLPHSQTRIIPGAGHIPQYSRPLDFQAAVLDAARLGEGTQ